MNDKAICQTCNCKWVSCKRHGDCNACIEHHAKSKKYPEPFCKKYPKPCSKTYKSKN